MNSFEKSFLISHYGRFSSVLYSYYQFLQHPTDTHWITTKRLLRYLKSTTDHGLLLSKSSILTIIAYIDVDCESCFDDRRSIGGYCIYHESSFVSWGSSKQKVISKSSIEAKFYALAHIAAELI